MKAAMVLSHDPTIVLAASSGTIALNETFAGDTATTGRTDLPVGGSSARVRSMSDLRAAARAALRAFSLRHGVELGYLINGRGSVSASTKQLPGVPEESIKPFETSLEVPFVDAARDTQIRGEIAALAFRFGEPADEDRTAMDKLLRPDVTDDHDHDNYKAQACEAIRNLDPVHGGDCTGWLRQGFLADPLHAWHQQSPLIASSMHSVLHATKHYEAARVSFPWRDTFRVNQGASALGPSSTGAHPLASVAFVPVWNIGVRAAGTLDPVDLRPERDQARLMALVNATTVGGSLHSMLVAEMHDVQAYLDVLSMNRTDLHALEEFHEEAEHYREDHLCVSVADETSGWTAEAAAGTSGRTLDGRPNPNCSLSLPRGLIGAGPATAGVLVLAKVHSGRSHTLGRIATALPVGWAAIAHDAGHADVLDVKMNDLTSWIHFETVIEAIEGFFPSSHNESSLTDPSGSRRRLTQQRPSDRRARQLDQLHFENEAIIAPSFWVPGLSPFGSNARRSTLYPGLPTLNAHSPLWFGTELMSTLFFNATKSLPSPFVELLGPATTISEALVLPLRTVLLNLQTIARTGSPLPGLRTAPGDLYGPVVAIIGLHRANTAEEVGRRMIELVANSHNVAIMNHTVMGDSIYASVQACVDGYGDILTPEGRLRHLLCAAPHNSNLGTGAANAQEAPLFLALTAANRSWTFGEAVETTVALSGGDSSFVTGSLTRLSSGGIEKYKPFIVDDNIALSRTEPVSQADVAKRHRNMILRPDSVLGLVTDSDVLRFTKTDPLGAQLPLIALNPVESMEAAKVLSAATELGNAPAQQFFENSNSRPTVRVDTGETVWIASSMPLHGATNQDGVSTGRVSPAVAVRAIPLQVARDLFVSKLPVIIVITVAALLVYMAFQRCTAILIITPIEFVAKATLLAAAGRPSIVPFWRLEEAQPSELARKAAVRVAVDALNRKTRRMSRTAANARDLIRKVTLPPISATSIVSATQKEMESSTVTFFKDDEAARAYDVMLELRSLMDRLGARDIVSQRFTTWANLSLSGMQKQRKASSRGLPEGITPPVDSRTTIADGGGAYSSFFQRKHRPMTSSSTRRRLAPNRSSAPFKSRELPDVGADSFEDSTQPEYHSPPLTRIPETANERGRRGTSHTSSEQSKSGTQHSSKSPSTEGGRHVPRLSQASSGAMPPESSTPALESMEAQTGVPSWAVLPLNATEVTDFFNVQQLVRQAPAVLFRLGHQQLDQDEGGPLTMWNWARRTARNVCRFVCCRRRSNYSRRAFSGFDLAVSLAGYDSDEEWRLLGSIHHRHRRPPITNRTSQEQKAAHPSLNSPRSSEHGSFGDLATTAAMWVQAPDAGKSTATTSSSRPGRNLAPPSPRIDFPPNRPQRSESDRQQEDASPIQRQASGPDSEPIELARRSEEGKEALASPLQSLAPSAVVRHTSVDETSFGGTALGRDPSEEEKVGSDQGTPQSVTGKKYTLFKSESPGRPDPFGSVPPDAPDAVTRPGILRKPGQGNKAGRKTTASTRKQQIPTLADRIAESNKRRQFKSSHSLNRMVHADIVSAEDAPDFDETLRSGIVVKGKVIAPLLDPRPRDVEASKPREPLSPHLLLEQAGRNQSSSTSQNQSGTGSHRPAQEDSSSKSRSQPSTEKTAPPSLNLTSTLVSTPRASPCCGEASESPSHGGRLCCNTRRSLATFVFRDVLRCRFCLRAAQTWSVARKERFRTFLFLLIAIVIVASTANNTNIILLSANRSILAQEASFFDVVVQSQMESLTHIAAAMAGIPAVRSAATAALCASGGQTLPGASTSTVSSICQLNVNASNLNTSRHWAVHGGTASSTLLHVLHRDLAVDISMLAAPDGRILVCPPDNDWLQQTSLQVLRGQAVPPVTMCGGVNGSSLTTGALAIPAPARGLVHAAVLYGRAVASPVLLDGAELAMRGVHSRFSRKFVRTPFPNATAHPIGRHNADHHLHEELLERNISSQQIPPAEDSTLCLCSAVPIESLLPQDWVLPGAVHNTGANDTEVQRFVSAFHVSPATTRAYSSSLDTVPGHESSGMAWQEHPATPPADGSSDPLALKRAAIAGVLLSCTVMESRTDLLEQAVAPLRERVGMLYSFVRPEGAARGSMYVPGVDQGLVEAEAFKASTRSLSSHALPMGWQVLPPPERGAALPPKSVGQGSAPFKTLHVGESKLVSSLWAFATGLVEVGQVPSDTADNTRAVEAIEYVLNAVGANQYEYLYEPALLRGEPIHLTARALPIASVGGRTSPLWWPPNRLSNEGALTKKPPSQEQHELFYAGTGGAAVPVEQVVAAVVWGSPDRETRVAFSFVLENLAIGVVVIVLLEFISAYLLGGAVQGPLAGVVRDAERVVNFAKLALATVDALRVHTEAGSLDAKDKARVLDARRRRMERAARHSETPSPPVATRGQGDDATSLQFGVKGRRGSRSRVGSYGEILVPNRTRPPMSMRAGSHGRATSAMQSDFKTLSPTPPSNRNSRRLSLRRKAMAPPKGGFEDSDLFEVAGAALRLQAARLFESQFRSEKRSDSASKRQGTGRSDSSETRAQARLAASSVADSMRFSEGVPSSLPGGKFTFSGTGLPQSITDRPSTRPRDGLGLSRIRSVAPSLEQSVPLRSETVAPARLAGNSSQSVSSDEVGGVVMEDLIPELRGSQNEAQWLVVFFEEATRVFVGHLQKQLAPDFRRSHSRNRNHTSGRSGKSDPAEVKTSPPEPKASVVRPKPATDSKATKQKTAPEDDNTWMLGGVVRGTKGLDV
jgi:hypothetical protein